MLPKTYEEFREKFREWVWFIVGALVVIGIWEWVAHLLHC